MNLKEDDVPCDFKRNDRATARGEVVSRAAVLLRSMAKTQQAQKSGQVQNPGPHLQHPRSR
jgi:hypothetical protein